MGNLAGTNHYAGGQAAFERLLIVITFLLIFMMAARTPLDSDMWWHLSAGDEMLRSGSILRTDVFSFSRAGADWVNPYWISQLGMTALLRWAGYLGLSTAVALLAVVSMGIVFAQCEGPVLLRTGALILASVVASVVWSPRPQLVSLVLTALTGYLIYQYKWRNRDVLWALPLVFLVWANTHPGYPLGLILIGAMIAGETLNHILALTGEMVLPWRKILRLLGWMVVCIAAVLLNPNGFKLWLLPFQTVDMQVLQQYIPEWASPDFHELLQQSLLWLLLACFAAVGLSGRLLDGSDLVTLLVFAFLALLARRNFGPFALVAAPILCRYGACALQSWHDRAGWLQGLVKKSEAKKQGESVNRGMNLALAAFIGLAAFVKLVSVSHPVVVNGYLAQAYPSAAVAWLHQNQPGERLLNEYNWGGYLQWQLREMPIFVDGRTDLFSDEIIGKWILAVQAGDGWQDVLDDYDIDVVMLQPDRPVLKMLDETGWTRLYADQQAVIYGR